MSTRSSTRPNREHALSEAEPVSRGGVLAWFAAGAALAFAVSFVGAGLLELQHDLYYLIYATVVVAFLASFLSHTRIDWRLVVRRNLAWSLLVGALLGFASVQTVLRDPATPHPAGPYYGFELAWRGVVYGAIDALILYVFPALVAYLLLGTDRHGAARKLRFGALAFGLALVITAVYHLGYPEWRSGNLLEPELGAVFGSLPALLTGNPVGAILLHDAFHVAGNIHAYQSGAFLPPDLVGYAEWGSGAAGLAVAALWVAASSAVMWMARDRLFPKGADGRRL